MSFLYVLLAAISPVIIAFLYINKKDSLKPEPTRWLIKSFVFGILSAFLSLTFSTLISGLFGLEFDNEIYPSIVDAFTDAFLLAAIPEELAKFTVLWLLLRKNPYFDEKFDGIVYAVCVGMGFAGIENVMYLFSGIEDGSWVSTSVARAIFSIPGHFLFAVLMGYYYSLYYWNIDRSMKAKILVLASPIIAHGLFDGILMSSQVDEGLAVLCMFAFLYFINKLRKIGKERINSLMNQ